MLRERPAAAGDPAWLLAGRANHAAALILVGDAGQACEELQSLLKCEQERVEATSRAAILGNMALAQAAEGEIDLAQAGLREALALDRELGAAHSEALHERAPAWLLGPLHEPLELAEPAAEAYRPRTDEIVPWPLAPEIIDRIAGRIVDHVARATGAKEAELLRVDREAIFQELYAIAHEAHGQQPSLTGTADVSQERLVRG